MSLISEYQDMSTGDWARDYLFSVMFQPPVLVAPLYPSDFDSYVLNFKAPGSKSKVIKKDWAGQWANFAGPLDNSGITEIELQVDESNRLKRFLDAWHALSGSDVDAAAFPKSQIVGQMHVTMYRTDKTTPIQTVTLYNVWLPEVGDLAMNKAGEGLLSVKVSVAYDRRGSTYHR